MELIQIRNIFLTLIILLVSFCSPVYSYSDTFDIKVLGSLGSLVRTPAIQEHNEIKISIQVKLLDGDRYPNLENQLQMLVHDFFSERKRFIVVSKKPDNDRTDSSATGEKLDSSKFVLNITYQPQESSKTKIGFLLISTFNSEIIAEKSMFVDHMEAELLFKETSSATVEPESKNNQSEKEPEKKNILIFSSLL